MSIERYEQILMAAIEIQQLQSEIKKHLAVIAKNMTVAELSNYSFNNELANKAFSVLKENKNIEIKSETHVQASLHYKDIYFYLHEQPNNLGQTAMKNILKEISKTSIQNA